MELTIDQKLDLLEEHIRELYEDDDRYYYVRNRFYADVDRQLVRLAAEKKKAETPVKESRPFECFHLRCTYEVGGRWSCEY